MLQAWVIAQNMWLVEKRWTITLLSNPIFTYRPEVFSLFLCSWLLALVIAPGWTALNCIFLIWLILLSFIPCYCEELFWEINDNLLWKWFLMGVIKALSVNSLTFCSLSQSLLKVHKLDIKILTVLHKKQSWKRTADLLRNILGSVLGSVFGA